MDYTNIMQKPRIEKVVVNIGVGESGERLVKAEKLLNILTNRKPVRTVSKHKIPSWGLRKGEPLGCKVTLRGSEAPEFLKRCLYAKDNKLRPSNFDGCNVCFGIHEYIDVQGIKYDPEIGIFGLNVNVTLERPGYRVKRRRLNSSTIPAGSRITAQEAMEFMKENFGVEVEEE